MNPILSLLATRVWACDPTHLRAWADAHMASGALVNAGMTPGERIDRVLAADNPIDVQIEDGVATVPVQGLLMHNGPWYAKLYGETTDYLDLRQVFDDLAANPKVRGVVLAIDSPGGDAIGLSETVAAIDRVRAAGKPVTAHISGLGASAAYYLASAADQIVAEPDALVGSIGTYAILTDTTGLQERLGIAFTVVSTGGVKGAGADGKVSDAYKADTQRTVDALGAVFRARVATGRRMDDARVAAVATGAVWLADEALRLGLIDATGPIPGRLAGTTHPAAAAATTPDPGQESIMDAKLMAALAALSQSLPTLAADLVAAANKPDATADGLHAFAAGKALAAKDAQIADLGAKLEAATAAKAKAESDLAALKGHATAHRDPGSDPPTAKLRSQMTRAEKAAYIREHGQDAYDRLPF
ncbi:MAG: hypothetical protein RLZZ524_603 [Pseudomonadota bacterium]|jgi:signal peptide peptidase SppA